MLRSEWLNDHEAKESDVMKDGDGHEYVMTKAGEGEMEDGVMTEFSGSKVYLPEKFENENGESI